MFFKIASNILKLDPNIRLYQTHYEILNLPQNCTAKQIKNAYIKLSKEYHPDVNKRKGSHSKFQEISEAYNVLGKVESRRSYDLSLTRQNQQRSKPSSDSFYYQEFGQNPYNDPSFWVNRDKRKDEYYQSEAYYGIHGVPRLSNGAILGFCVFFLLMGVGLQYILITKSLTFKRDVLVKNSQEHEEALNRTRDTAAANGNAEQLALLKTRLLGDNK